MRRRRSALALLGLLLVVCTAPREACAEGELAAARRTFLENRNTCAFEQAVSGLPATNDERLVTDVLLALMACQKAVPAPAPNSRGYEALPEVVAALRATDLEAASAAAARVGAVEGGGVGTWARALILARGGRDAEAIALLLGPPADPSLDPERVLFPLAIFGTALPRDDRLLLSATGRETLLEACRRGKLDRVASLARQIAALDPTLGPDAICLAARALRRSGRMQAEAGALLSGPETAVDGRARGCVQLERAVLEWREGRGARARALARGLGPEEVGPAEAFLARALERAGDGMRPVSPAPHGLGGLGSPEATTLARFATLLGASTSPQAVEALALGRGRDPAAPAFASEVLTSFGLDVVVSAGSPRVGEEALARGLPFLLYRVRLRGDVFVEEPVLVRGRDPATGLWVVDPEDLREVDALEPDAPLKGRFLVAVPEGFDASPTAWAGERERVLGRTLTTALDLAAGGQVQEAAAHLERRVPDLGGEPAFEHYRAFLQYRLFLETKDAQALHVAADAASHAAASRPATAFEHVVHGQSRQWFSGTEEGVKEAEEAFAKAQRLRPDSAWLALYRFQLLKDTHRPREALDAVEAARVLDPRDTRSLFLRGVLRQQLGATAEAREDLRRAFDRRRTSPTAAFELVDLELDDGRPAAALAVLDQYVAAAPEAATDDTVLAARRVAEGQIVQEATTVEALRPFLASPLPETRRRVVFALARIETSEAEAALRPVLGDQNHAVRVTVLRVYMRPWLRTRVETEESLGNQVVELLRRDESAVVRGAAAGLLGLVRKDYAVRELAASLAGDAKDPDPYPRSEAASALARHDGPLARRALVDALEDEDLAVRRAAVNALFRLAITHHGYDPEAPPEERAEAVERWKRWLRENAR